MPLYILSYCVKILLPQWPQQFCVNQTESARNIQKCVLKLSSRLRGAARGPSIHLLLCKILLQHRLQSFRFNQAECARSKLKQVLQVLELGSRVKGQISFTPFCCVKSLLSQGSPVVSGQLGKTIRKQILKFSSRERGYAPEYTLSLCKNHTVTLTQVVSCQLG